MVPLPRRLARWAVSAAAALSAAGLAPALAPAAHAAPPARASWTAQATPAPRLTSAAVLSSVACPTPRTCIAVGYAVDAAGAPAPLVERLDGRRWRIQGSVMPASVTSGFLFGVACATPRSCTAVGSVTRPSLGTIPFAERLDAGRWAAERVPRPRRRTRGEVDYLGAVSCPGSGVCMAVGYAGNPQGTAGRALTERWTAASGWTLEPAPSPARAASSFLSGVSCPSTRSCTAVGFASGRNGVGAALAERWTPAGWTMQRIPTPAGATLVQLSGVACPSASLCMAAGSFQVAGIEVLLAERWNGARWVIGRPRYPAGARGAALAEVSCPSVRACTAVGSFTDTPGVGEPLAERWTSRGWAIQPTPSPATAADPLNAGLAGVSCPSLTRCVAVGSATPLSGEGGEPVSLSWGT